MAADLKKRGGYGEMYYLRMEHIVSNAFICFKRRYLTFTEIEEYGKKVMSKINGILLFSRDHTREFLSEYGKYFERDGKKIRLKDGITYDTLVDEFRGYLPLELLRVFTDVEREYYGLEKDLGRS